MQEFSAELLQLAILAEQVEWSSLLLFLQNLPTALNRLNCCYIYRERTLLFLEAQVIIISSQTSIKVIQDLRVKHGILVGGVDEAGRGSIIGPLVVAGIGIREGKLAQLRKMGVRDSKTLTPKARAKLFGEIIKTVDSICIRKVEPDEVDGSVVLHGLNKLEARVMANVIDSIGADEVYVDCCDVNPTRYRESIAERLSCHPKRLHSLHHADSLNVAVSAASIIAKITRDQEIQELRNKYGPEIGSGYPSDAMTMEFIRSWVEKKGQAPEFARKSWTPLRLIMQQSAQCTLYGP